MADKEFESFDAHFPARVSQELVDYATNVALLWSRYIFTRREGKRQYGYCTHCRKECETQGLRHGTEATCALCGSECRVRASGRGRSRLVDEVYFVYYEKSVLNPQAITARGIRAIRDYRVDYRGVETQFSTRAMYLFAPGHSEMYERWTWYSDSQEAWVSGSWMKRKSISSLMGGPMQFKPVFCSRESIQSGVQGTPFQYSTWEQYPEPDWVKFFDLAAKYPCIEYLTKLGMSGLVKAKLHGEKAYGTINWRGKTPAKVLRMSKQEFNDLRAANVHVTPWLLHLRQLSLKDGSNLTIAELNELQRELNGYDSSLQKALTRTTLRQLNGYLSKQLRRDEVREHYGSKSQLLRTWNDYLADCLKLGLNTTISAVTFPSNLYRAHQNTIKQIKVKEDEALRSKIDARNKALQKLRFEALGFLLRPARSAKELIAEGKALQHCVGTYAADYASGKTDIFVLRRVVEPNKPFYTVEIRNGHIEQCRGHKNCVPTKDVKAFVELFVSKKLLTKKRTRVGIAV